MTAHGQTMATLIGIAIGLITLGGLLWKRLGPVVDTARYLHGEDGDPKRGWEPRPGVLERQTLAEQTIKAQAAELGEVKTELGEVKSMLAEVVAAVRNNGGSSLLDKVEQIGRAVTSGNTAQAGFAARQEARA